MQDLSKPIGFIKKRLEPYAQTIDEYISSESQVAYYHVIKKKKRRGGYRFLYFCVNNDIRSAHKIIYEMLRDYQPQIHHAAHGFIKGRSTLTNALNHVEQNYLVHLDIKDFFDSVTIAQVRSALLGLGISDDVAEYISKLTTVDGVLRQGLHTSPDLSNHCLRTIDIKLEQYASSNDFAYTRYGDDITLSGSSKPDPAPMVQALSEEGFTVNQDKIKVQKRGANQYVTGLTVFDERPRIPRRFKKRLRLMIYYINRYGFTDHVQRTRGINRDDFETEEEFNYYLQQAIFGSSNYIIGHIAYLNSVEPEKVDPMWVVLNDQNVKDSSGMTSK